MLCLPIEIEIFEMVEKKYKKIFWENTFFQNRVIFIYEALLNPYYLPIAMGGMREEQRPYMAVEQEGVITNILIFYYYGYFKWYYQENGRLYRRYDLQAGKWADYCQPEDYEHC